MEKKMAFGLSGVKMGKKLIKEHSKMGTNNSFFRQPILQVILAITITAPAYAQFDRILEYKGRWSCMTTDNFTYEYGTLKKEENKPFGLVIGIDRICKQVAKEWQIITKNKKMGYSLNCNPLF
jgi:hypothetical protein